MLTLLWCQEKNACVEVFFTFSHSLNLEVSTAPVDWLLFAGGERQAQMSASHKATSLRDLNILHVCYHCSRECC